MLGYRMAMSSKVVMQRLEMSGDRQYMTTCYTRVNVYVQMPTDQLHFVKCFLNTLSPYTALT